MRSKNYKSVISSAGQQKLIRLHNDEEDDAGSVSQNTHQATFFLSIAGAGTSHSSQILFLRGLNVSTLSSH